MTLPIAEIREQFVDSLDRYPVIIINAPTGAGKSTQLIQYALNAGRTCLGTQPRILAAQMVAARIAEELGEELGLTIGYRTGEDRLDSDKTRTLICTDGLALIRQLMCQNDFFNTLFLDEIHEYNLNMEVLLAWVKYALRRGEKFNVVILSATLEGEKLSKFFGGAPVISVEGRQFPVTQLKKGKSEVEDVVRMVRQGLNSLVFLSGKPKIFKMMRALARYNLDAEIFPLHGTLRREEQERCLAHYDRPKVILATNIAQTSITIDDIDVVIDSGLEKKTFIVNGVEGLYERVISKADSIQRMGRVGRTKPGFNINHCPSENQSEFPIPEIQRCHLDMAYLRLKLVNVSMEEFEFLHDPGKDSIARSKRNLFALGCLDKSGNVTEIGEKVSLLPLAPYIGRMVIEGEKLGVLDDVITIAAIIEAKGIVDRKNNYWRDLVKHEVDSDLLAQLDLFKIVSNASEMGSTIGGLCKKNFAKACKISKKIRSRAFESAHLGSTKDRESILRAVCAGMVNNLFRYDAKTKVISNENATWELSDNSIVKCDSNATWLVGIPFDLEQKRKEGIRIRHILNLATKIDTAWLLDVAPALAANVERSKPRYDPQHDCVMSTRKIIFNRTIVEEENYDDSQSSHAVHTFASWIASQALQS